MKMTKISILVIDKNMGLCLSRIVYFGNHFTLNLGVLNFNFLDFIFEDVSSTLKVPGFLSSLGGSLGSSSAQGLARERLYGFKFE